MTTKAEARDALHQLFAEWRGVAGDKARDGEADFSAFKRWLAANGFDQYLRFRSTTGADRDVEQWFDAYFRQGWKN